MSQQVITIGNNGADSRRVLDALTPVNGVAAPAVHAKYLGQVFVDTVAAKVYIAIATASTDPADDWMELAAAL